MITFDILTDTERLSCFSTTHDPKKRTLLFLHGAGASDKSRTIWLAEYLARAWIDSVGFDFSGHGESTKEVNCSIRKRVLETRKILEECFMEGESIILCAFSMSGQVVMELLMEMHDRVEMCFLCAPALYHCDAVDLEFGEKFTKLLREDKSYHMNNSLEALENYHGKIVLVIWDQDTVIPYDIPNIIEASHKNGIFKKYIIPNAPHMLALWTTESHENLETLGAILVDEIMVGNS